MELVKFIMKINNTINLKNVILFAASTLALASAHVSAEDLAQIYKLALENDPQFKSAKATLDAWRIA